MMDQKKDVALITGATEGIGKETARQLARKNIHVVIGARSPEKGAKVVEELEQEGLHLDTVQINTCDPSSVTKAVETLQERYGRLDILVNNAGIALDDSRISELDVEKLISTFETNVFGTFRVIQAMLPLLRASSHPRVVNVSSSLASLQDMTNPESRYYDVLIPAYAASKAALNVLTIHLARDLAEDGIKINAVEPGLTATRAVSLPGAQPVEVGAKASVDLATIDPSGPTGGFFDQHGPFRW